MLTGNAEFLQIQRNYHRIELAFGKSFRRDFHGQYIHSLKIFGNFGIGTLLDPRANLRIAHIQSPYQLCRPDETRNPDSKQ